MNGITQRPKSEALSSRVMNLNVSIALRKDTDEVLTACWVPGHESIFYSSNVSGSSVLGYSIYDTHFLYGKWKAQSIFARLSLCHLYYRYAITSDLSNFVFLSTNRIFVYAFASIHVLNHNGITSDLLPLSNIYVGKQLLPSSIFCVPTIMKFLLPFLGRISSFSYECESVELWDLGSRLSNLAQ